MSDKVQPVKSFSVTLTKDGKTCTMTVQDKSNDGIFNNGDSIKFSGDSSVFTSEDIQNALKQNGYQNTGNADANLTQAENADNKVTVKGNTEYSLGSIAKSLGMTTPTTAVVPAVQTAPSATAAPVYNPMTPFSTLTANQYMTSALASEMQSKASYYKTAIINPYSEFGIGNDNYTMNDTVTNYEMSLMRCVLDFSRYLAPVGYIAPAGQTNPAETTPAAATPGSAQAPAPAPTFNVDNGSSDKSAGTTPTGTKPDGQTPDALKAIQEKAKALGIKVTGKETADELQKAIDAKNAETKTPATLSKETEQKLKAMGVDTTKVKTEADGQKCLQLIEKGQNQYVNSPEANKRNAEIADLQKQLDEENKKDSMSIDLKKTKELNEKIAKLKKEVADLEQGKKGKEKEQELLEVTRNLNEQLDNYNRAWVKVFVLDAITRGQARIKECEAQLSSVENYYSPELREALENVNARLKEMAEKGSSPIKTK